jgi:hypothetical protein
LFTTPSLTISNWPPSLFLNTDYAHTNLLSVKRITNTQTFHTWNFLDVLQTSADSGTAVVCLGCTHPRRWVALYFRDATGCFRDIKKCV